MVSWKRQRDTTCLSKVSFRSIDIWALFAFHLFCYVSLVACDFHELMCYLFNNTDICLEDGPENPPLVQQTHCTKFFLIYMDDSGYTTLFCTLALHVSVTVVSERENILELYTEQTNVLLFEYPSFSSPRSSH